MGGEQLRATLWLPDNDGLKGIPIGQLPEAAWRTVFGSAESHGLDKLYSIIPWLYRGVNHRAQATAGVPYAWRLQGSGDLVSDEDLPQPYKNIVAQLGIPPLLDCTEGWLSLYGAAYYLKIPARIGGATAALQPLHPSTIQLDINDTNGLVGFKRTVGGSTIEYTLDQVVAIWRPSRLAEVGPDTAPALAALQAANILQSKGQYMATFFKSGALNPMLVSIVEGNPSKEEKETLVTFLRKRISGIANAFGIQLITSRVEVTRLGSEIGELAQRELTDQQREDIATALGVPQSVLFSNAANYATARQDALNFYENVVKPELAIIADALNEQVFEAMGLTLVPQPELLELYQQQEAEKADRLANLVMVGIMTNDEARQQLGLPTREKTDEGGPMTPPALPAPIVEGAARPTGEEPVAAELRRWQDKMIRRIQEGKPERGLTFESKVLSPWLVARIQAQLAHAKDREAVRGVFGAANHAWHNYP